MSNYTPLIVYTVTLLSYIILRIIGIYIGIVAEILVGLFVILTLIIIMIYRQAKEILK